MGERRTERPGLRGVRDRLGYANVMATLAVFIALGGGAWAVAIGRNDVGSREIAKNAVGTSELKNDKATGRDINESSLGEVPSAAFAQRANTSESAKSASHADIAESANSASTAANAAQVNGLSVVKINWRQPNNTPTQTILDLAGLQLKALCSANTAEISAETTKSNSSIYLHGVQTDTNSPADDFAFDLEGGNFNPATPVDVDQQLGGGGVFPILGSIAYESADGSEVTVDFAMDINGTSKCVLTGTAIGG
jgi:hypothetical protein